MIKERMQFLTHLNSSKYGISSIFSTFGSAFSLLTLSDFSLILEKLIVLKNVAPCCTDISESPLQQDGFQILIESC